MVMWRVLNSAEPRLKDLCVVDLNLALTFVSEINILWWWRNIGGIWCWPRGNNGYSQHWHIIQELVWLNEPTRQKFRVENAMGNFITSMIRPSFDAGHLLLPCHCLSTAMERKPQTVCMASLASLMFPWTSAVLFSCSYWIGSTMSHSSTVTDFAWSILSVGTETRRCGLDK